MRKLFMSLFILTFVSTIIKAQPYSDEYLKKKELEKIFPAKTDFTFGNFSNTSIFNTQSLLGMPFVTNSPSFGFIKCKTKDGMIQYELDKLHKSADDISKHYACNAVISENQYDKETSCKIYEQCANSLLMRGAIDSKTFLQNSTFSSMIIPIMRRVVAEDYAKKTLKNNLNDINKYKYYRKLSEKMGIAIPAIDKCENENVQSKCDETLMDSSFVEVQKSCTASQGYECYNLEDKEFTSIEKKKDEDMKGDLYLDRLADAKVVAALENESSNFDTIYNAVSTQCTKQLNKANIKEVVACKVKKLKTALNKLDQENKADPFLKQLKDEDYTLELFVKEVVGTPHSTAQNKNDYRSKFNKFRSDMIKPLFSSCKKNLSIQKICNISTGIMNNDRSAIPQVSQSELSALYSGVDENDLKEYYEKFNKAPTSQTVQSFNEFSSLVKGVRCFSLTYGYKEEKITDLDNGRECLNTSLIKNTPAEGSLADEVAKAEKAAEEQKLASSIFYSNVKMNSENKLDGPDFVGPRETVKINHTEPISKDNINTSTVGSLTSSSTDNKIESSDSLDLNRKLADSLNNPNLNGFQNTDLNKKDSSSFIPYSSGLIDLPVKDEKLEKVEKDKIAKKETDLLEEKLKELNKKVTASEEALAKLKEKKIEEANIAKLNEKDTQIQALEAQLKNIRNDVIATKQKISSASTVEKIEPAVIAKSPVFTSTSSAKSNDDSLVASSGTTARTNSDENKDGSTSTMRGPASVSSAITSNIQSNNSAVSSASASTSGVRYQGLTLTKMDGLSVEAISESINSKISEGKGQTFFIEEGGFVKEIIPIMKDGKLVLDDKGKPVFEKIIKGKVADIKAKEAIRAAASVSNQADLRKAEELKVRKEQDRQKYEALKKLSSDAVK